MSHTSKRAPRSASCSVERLETGVHKCSPAAMTQRQQPIIRPPGPRGRAAGACSCVALTGISQVSSSDIWENTQTYRYRVYCNSTFEHKMHGTKLIEFADTLSIFFSGWRKISYWFTNNRYLVISLVNINNTNCAVINTTYPCGPSLWIDSKPPERQHKGKVLLVFH